MSSPDESQLIATIKGVRSLLDDLELGVKNHGPGGGRSNMTLVQLARRAGKPAKRYDGYSTTSMGGMGSNGGTSDRTFDAAARLAALGGNPPDPTRVALRKALDGLEAADRGLSAAVSALVSVIPKAPVEVDTWCRVCTNAVVEKADRCWWCYDWWNNYGFDVPEAIVEARRAGKKITSKLVQEVLDKRVGAPARGRR